MSTQVQKLPGQSYTITIARPDQLPEVLKIMREHFYHEETMFKSLCSNVTARAQFENDKVRINEYFDGTIKAAFEASPCIIAIHNETSEAAGAIITAVSVNSNLGDNNKDGLATIFSSKKSVPPVIEKYVEYLSKINDEANLFLRFPKARSIWEYYAIAVSEKHRKLGLAGDMMTAGIALAKQAEISFVFGVFTSIYTQKAAAKVGMRAIIDLDLCMYKNENGTPVFENCEPQNIVTVMGCEVL